MQTFATSPWELVRSFWRHRDLIGTLTKREIASRYRGSVAGILWSLFNPILMLLIYTFVFSTIFGARWNTENESQIQFALVLFSGLIAFNFFSECVTKAPDLVMMNVNYVKKVVFPLDILAWVNLGAALFHAVISLCVWFLFHLLFVGVPPVTGFLLPAVFLPLVLLTVGLSWVLASLGVFLRDTAQVVGILIPATMFLSPIFYPVSAVSEDYRYLIYMSPLTHILESIRSVLIWNELPGWRFFGVLLPGSALIAWIGFYWFQQTRRGFADVL